MVDIIVPLIPKHKIYVEPFFGGGSIFFAKGPSFLEVINDINDNVINFFRVMKSDFKDLAGEIDLTLMSESMHKEALNIYRNPNGQTNLKRAWAFWMVTNFSFANKPGGGWKFDSGSEGSHSGIILERRKNQFKFYEDRLKNVHISCRDTNRVIHDRDGEETFFYLDPPYPGSDQGHYKGYEQRDLLNLLKTLELIRGKFLLSNYRNQYIDEFVNKNGWAIREYDMRLSAPRQKGLRKIEALIMNYQPDLKLF